MWQARIVPMSTATDQFSQALDKGRMSLGQYTRFAASQLPGMSRVFKREFEMMNQVATENVRQMQTQYVALGRSATGAAQAMALTPTALDAQASRTAIATQRQMMMNRMIDLGTTKLLNWGKNTQWAGRQLMVGFSIPLGLMGAAAAKAFKEIDQGTISFKRVYGDLQTTTAEMERNLEAVKQLGAEYTRYGNSLAETVELAAAVAATGARNNDLTAATEQTLRLATLGLMENAEAMEAVVALQTAFQISSEDLAESIDFLNVVENETILTMQDMAAAIPRVAPVIKGLGGDVKDLAVFMTALREGGVSAEQGANALKSGLGRLINPTKAAREETEKYGISIDAIVQRNRGDLMGTVTEFGQALSALGQLEQQQVLQKVFGTYQYARLGALFRNIANDAGQAQRTMELTAMSVEDLAKISERELSKIEEATSVKFQAAIEKLKIAIAPIGETFMKALTPVIDIASRVLDAFNNLPDGVKNAIAIAVAAIAGIGPIVLMTVGLIANGIANIGKLVQVMRKFFARLRGDTSAFEYLTKEEREAATAANALSGATDTLTGKFLGQQRALGTLITLVGNYTTALSNAAAAAPLAFGMGAAGNVPRSTPGGTVVTGPRTGGTVVVGPGGMRMAKGGIVPGTGNKDTVPAMLTPGESVVTKEATQKYGPMIQAMNAGTIPGFINGVTNVSGSYLTGAAKPISPIAIMQPGAGGNQSMLGVSRSEFMSPTGQASFAAAGKAAADFATRMDTLSRFSMSALKAFDPLDDLFNKMHGEISSQLKTSQTIDEAITKAKPEVNKILSEYMKQKAVNGELTATEGKRLRIATRLLLGEQTTIARVGGLARAERVDVREGQASRIRTQTVQMPGAVGAPLSTYRRMPQVTQREFSRRGLETPRGFSSYQRSHLMSVGAMPFMPGLIPARVQGTNLGQQERQSIQEAAMSGKKIGKLVADEADRAMGNRSPSVRAQQSVTQYVDGLEVGAAKNTGDASKAGKVVGNSFAESVKQSIMAGKTAPGLIPGAAKREYMIAQSASRREAYNIREMQRIGMTDAQIIRQLDRLKTSKEKQAQAQEKQARLAQSNANLAQRNAALAQQSNKNMVIEEQARKRGLRTRVSEYFATPVGDGTQTRGQAMRSRIAAGGGAATMGLMGLSMAASMAGGSVGEMAQKVMPVTMGLMGLQMILPMLTNPIGLAILAIGGLTTGFIYLRKQLDDTAKKAAEMGANIGGVANGMKIIEEATGFAPPQLEDRLFRFSEEDRAAMTEFSSYFESEAGSKFIQELREASSAERYEKVARLLTQAVASGLEQEKAKAFGFAIAEATGDALLKSGIARDFANQFIQSGSQTLINLEKERMTLAPEIGQVSQISRMGAYQRTFEQPGVNPDEIRVTTEGYFDRILRTINVFKTFSDFFLGQAQEIEKVEITGEGLGFALQTIQNLTNAEAVLEEERRKGLITLEEYTSRSGEIDTLQQQTSDYLGQIFAVGSDTGAMLQALGDQLSFAGFNEDQIKRITQRFNPNALAQQFFDVQTFAQLSEDQQNYVEEVLTKTLSGLTPENIEQRFQDVEGTYTQIADQVVQSMMSGLYKGLDITFNQQEMADFIEQRMGGSFGFGSKQVLPKTLAKNVMVADEELKKLGTDSIEVFTRLTEFLDTTAAKKIMTSQEEITKFGNIVAKLAEYEEINLEIVMKEGFDPDDIVNAIEDINKMKLNPDIFGPFTLNVEKFVANLVNAGINVENLPEKFQAATNAVGTFGKKAVDSLGNIKPTIVPKVIANVLGVNADSASEIADALNSAFPSGLTPIDLAIMLSLEGDPYAISLLSNPNAIKAAMAGEKTFTESVRVGGETFRRDRLVAPGLSAVAPFISGGAEATGEKPKDTSGGGGGESQSWLEGLAEEISANMKLFVGDVANSVPSLMNQLKSKFKGIEIPTRILEMIGAGPEGLKKAKELLGLTKGQMSKFVKNFIKSTGAEAVQGLKVEVGQTVRKTTAARKLSGESEEVRDTILENQALTDVIATYKKSSPEYKNAIKQARELARAKKDLADATATEEEKQQEAIKAIDEARQPILNDFARREALFQQRFGEIEREWQPIIAANEKQIDLLQSQIDAVQEQINAIEKLNSADQRRIRDLERQKEMIQRQINSIEKQNEIDQRRIQTLNREDEMRSRVAEGLRRDIDLLSDQEEKIRNNYQKRIDALNKISQINDQISNKQKQQIDLSRALSEGDIYAAATAAEAMRESSAQFASDQLMSSFEQGMQNEVSGLRTQGGLSREEAEQRIKDIQDQSYQVSLQIKEIEDLIYERNLQLIPLKDQQYNIDQQIQGIQDIIYDRETQILDIQVNRLQPLQDQLTAQQKSLSNNQQALADAKAAVKIEGQTYDELQNQISAEKEAYDVAVAQIKVGGDVRNSVENIRKKWVDVTRQIAAAVRTARQLREEAEIAAQSEFNDINVEAAQGRITADTAEQKKADAASRRDTALAAINEARDAEIAAALSAGTQALRMAKGGLIKGYRSGGMVSGMQAFSVGGKVFGNGSRDSIPAMLTPGEFVVRKAMVKKYGSSMMDSINQGSFSLPRYSISDRPVVSTDISSSNSIANINAPVYNTYDMKFAINGTNASVDEIANKVVLKMRNIDNGAIRRLG
jgi:TP901 family phage tail tape measure protein